MPRTYVSKKRLEAGIAMGTPERKPFGQEIHKDVIAIFDRVHAEVGGKRYELLESMIRSFSHLPRMTQRILLAARPEDREPVLRLLAGLAERPSPTPVEKHSTRKGKA